MNELNILEIAVLIVVILFAAAGYRKGFVRKLSAMLSLVLSIVLVSAVLPYITQALKENTPVYDYIVEQCNAVIEKQVTARVASELSGSSTDTGDAVSEYQNLSRDQIKQLMEQNGYDSSIVDSLSDEQLEAYKEQYIQQYVSDYLGTSDTSSSNETDSDSGTSSAGLNGLTRIEQTELIENLPLPDMLKDLLLDYNNDEGYKGLRVSNFSDYLVGFIATNILNLIAFLISVILVQLILRIIFHALNLAANLPVLRVINRLGGLALGLVQALIVLWVVFLILSMLSGTSVGMQITELIEKSQVLSALYNGNLFLPAVVRTSAIFS